MRLSVLLFAALVVAPSPNENKKRKRNARLRKEAERLGGTKATIAPSILLEENLVVMDLVIKEITREADNKSLDKLEDINLSTPEEEFIYEMAETAHNNDDQHPSNNDQQISSSIFEVVQQFVQSFYQLNPKTTTPNDDDSSFEMDIRSNQHSFSDPVDEDFEVLSTKSLNSNQ